jgi:hypothetical protein
VARRIPVGRILMPRKNVTAGANPLLLMSLTHMLRSTTEDAPPITVRREGPHYRIIDGRHRFMAAVIAGRPSILARVED